MPCHPRLFFEPGFQTGHELVKPRQIRMLRAKDARPRGLHGAGVVQRAAPERPCGVFFALFVLLVSLIPQTQGEIGMAAQRSGSLERDRTRV